MRRLEREWPLIIVGSGPAGIGVALEAKGRGVRALMLDRGALCNTLFRFPERMTYFSTSELLEFPGIPLVAMGAKPTKREVLEYFVRIVLEYRLPFVTDCEVRNVRREGDRFTVDSARGEFSCEAVVLATGSYDQPNLVGVPGEELPHVSHYYDSPHRCIGRRVVVVGGKNSAAEAALELHRTGALVTLVHRGEGLTGSIKYWIRPDLENRIREGAIQAFFRTSLTAIRNDSVTASSAEGSLELEADDVFLLTGYKPDYDWLKALGLQFADAAEIPVHSTDTLESNVSGLYVAGVLLAGREASRVFIENSREHGARILDHFLRS
ncbi:MAG: YpdA family putative bacillithiol disulfide reductase [Calditrichaeota bacterium]|nr:YpdA family putative bacillithiol disulfide reductase [Calditrichota bacterium]MCB9366313.1 YpdA family putative bacillithiol disulfide reductase [Calditrichota bacterium]